MLHKTSHHSGQKAPVKILRCWLVMPKNDMSFDIERCEMLSIWTLVAVSPAVRLRAMRNC